jgi:uncharacterized protein YecT (DUF1311 family)
MLSLIALIAAAGSVSPAAACPGMTTIEVNACLVGRLGEADHSLNQYYQAALGRVQKESRHGAAQKLVQSERSWIAYRDQECNAVDIFWSGGTIRASMSTDCKIRLTRFRTYVVWRDWLTYPDSSPPGLPRPEIEKSVLEPRG